MGKKKNESDAFSLEQVSVRLVSAPPLYSDKAISSPEDAVKLLANELQEYDREVVAIINLNGQNVPINFSVLSIGGLNYAVAEPREMLKNMILSNACSALLLHNHPSGDVTPSDIDIALTDKVVQVCDLVGIPVLDHIIIGNPITEEVYSFRQHDKIPKSKLHFATSVSDIKWTGASGDVSSDKKYELTDETKVITDVYGQEHTLHRIRALRDFDDIRAGDLGGWVESEHNLSQEGSCWVSGVSGEAKVYGEAQVSGTARVYDDAHVFGSAKVYGYALVHGNAKVYGAAHVSDNALVSDKACVYGSTLVYDTAKIYGTARVYDDAHVHGDAKVSGEAHIFDHARVYGDTKVSDAAEVSGDVHVCGNAHVCGDARVCGDAVLTSGEFTEGIISRTPQAQEEQTEEHKAPAKHR